MSDFSKVFEEFMKQGQDMAGQLGKKFARNQSAYLDQMKELMPENMADMAQGMIGEGIDTKTRALATIAGLTAKGAEDTAVLTAAINGALTAGPSRREITETILQMTAVGAMAGVPKAMMAAMTVFAIGDGVSQ